MLARQISQKAGECSSLKTLQDNILGSLLCGRLAFHGVDTVEQLAQQRTSKDWHRYTIHSAFWATDRRIV